MAGSRELSCPTPAGTAASEQAALAPAEARIALLQAQVNQACVAWSHQLMFAAVAGLPHPSAAQLMPVVNPALGPGGPHPFCPGTG
jgi:hypothetical protein